MALHQGDKEALLQALQDVPYVPDVVTKLGAGGISLVLEVCKLGFTDVLEFLINQGAELTSPQGTVCGKSESRLIWASNHSLTSVLFVRLA